MNWEMPYKLKKYKYSDLLKLGSYTGDIYVQVDEDFTLFHDNKIIFINNKFEKLKDFNENEQYFAFFGQTLIENEKV